MVDQSKKVASFLSLILFFFLGCAHEQSGPTQDLPPALEKSEPRTSIQKSAQESARPFPLALHPEAIQWCESLDVSVRKLGWKIPKCDPSLIRVKGKSVEGRPLVYADFGEPGAMNRTLIFTMVHSDEITPLYIGMRLLHWLKVHIKNYPSTRVVVAPLVNPDGFYRKVKTRTNSRGVDLNRNFATSDWLKDAHRSWKRRYRSDPRKYPGSVPESEPETLFQKDLIEEVDPQKVLSIHAPLNFMDYDGPSVLTLAKFPREYVRKCLNLREQMNARSGGFFPGSLGNYAGREMGIPTLTLELPTANPRNAKKYWNKFKDGIQTVIEFQVPELVANNKNE